MNDVLQISKYDRFLAGSEVVVLTCRQHPVVLAKAVLIWLGAVVLSLAMAARAGDRGRAFTEIAGLVFLLATLYLVGCIGEWWFAHFVVTNKRVIKVEGIVNRKIGTIPLGKITDTAYRRTWLGRILGYGDMVLDTPGQDKYLPVLDKLSKPDRVYQTIMSIAMGGGAPPASPPKRRPPSEDDTGPIPVPPAPE